MVVELAVINQIHAAIVVAQQRIVPIRNFGTVFGPETPAVIRDNRESAVGIAPIVQDKLFKNRRSPIHIDIGPLHVLAAEHAHGVAALGRIEPITHEQVVVAIAIRILEILDVRTLATHIITATHVDAHVRVLEHRSPAPLGSAVVPVLVRIVPETGRLIELDQEKPAAPRTVQEPQVSILVVEHVRVDAAGTIAAIPLAQISDTVVCDIVTLVDCRRTGHLRVVGIGGRTRRLLVHPAVDDRTLVLVRPLDLVGCQEHNGTFPVLARHRKVQAPLFQLLVPHDIGRPQVPLGGRGIRMFRIVGFRLEHAVVIVPGLVASDIHRAAPRKLRRKRGPVQHIAGICRPVHGPEYVIILRPRLGRIVFRIRIPARVLIDHNDGRIVNGDRGRKCGNSRER